MVLTSFTHIFYNCYKQEENSGVPLKHSQKSNYESAKL